MTETERGRRVAVLGAGPVGLDAALAFREAGSRVTVYEAGPAVGQHVRRWGHVRLFTPWAMNASPRMRRHLAAAGTPLPADDDVPTGDELVERLLEPVAASPLLDGVVRTGTRVLGIARTGLLKHEAIGTGERARRPFRLLLEEHGRETGAEADLVVDCTGSHARANAVGDGGVPAPGERALDHRIVRRLPDLRRDAAAWAGRTTLLVGAGKSAQTAARDLAALSARDAATGVVWAVRSPDPDWGEVPDDPLPQRQELVATARALEAGAVPGVEVRRGTTVTALRDVGGRTGVTLGTAGRSEEVVVDRVLALTGHLGDATLSAQLQVHECYATAAPMALSAALLAAAGDGPADCLAQPRQGVDVLRSPEPDFFVLGSKSYGRNSAFLLRVGHEQVDALLGAYAPAADPLAVAG